MKFENKILCGDSTKLIKKISDNHVNLIYLDPPFFTEHIFEAKGRYGKINSFSDKWDRDMDSYLDSMIEVLQECHRVLKDTGTLYIHCDWHAVHYLKVELDKIFGRKNFQNEIIWRRHSVHNNSRHGTRSFGRVHDSILFYSKSKKNTWNPIYQPYSEEYVSKTYRRIEPETGRRFALGDLSGPGGRSKGNPRYKFMGITRYWRYCETSMKRLQKENRIYHKPGNVPRLKRYLDSSPGIILQDVWDDLKSVQTSKEESVGYPTQKPVRLLERIIQVSSNEKDLVLDPMCGSGTALVACKNLRRNFIGIDSNKQACKIARNRIKSRETKSEIMSPVVIWP